MKKLLILTSLLITFQLGYSQTKVTWNENEEINKSSFMKEPPNLANDNIQEYSFATSFDFSFQMVNIQFTFTKNFNSYVNAYYIPSHSWIEEGEFTDQLLLMANLDFDLSELYARKFRKRMFEAKNVGSNINFYNEIYEQIIMEYNDHRTIIQSEIRSRENPMEYLRNEIEKVNQQINTLNEFCKTCKPQKNKRKR